MRVAPWRVTAHLPVNKGLDPRAIEEIGIGGIAIEQMVCGLACKCPLDPRLDRRIEEADLRLVDDRVGNDPARRLFEQPLRRPAMDL